MADLLKDIAIEEARPPHATRIEELELQAFSVDPCRLAEAAFRRKNDPVVALVATRGRRVCGYVTGATCWHGRSLNLWMMALVVSPHLRRRGVGKRLLEALIETGRTLGATRVRLLVRPENEPAMALYAAAGFHVLTRQPDELGPGRDVLVMARSSDGGRRSF